MLRPSSRLSLGVLLAVTSACGGGPSSNPSGAASPSSLDGRLEAESRAMLLEMSAVDTSNGNETEALRTVAARLDEAHVPYQILENEKGRGNLVARLKGSGAKRPLLLLAHIDVVPVAGQPWTVKPFPPIEKDGFVWGRGVADDKSMAAAFTAIVLELARSKVPLSRDVILALTAGEETGGFAGAKWLVEKHRPLVDAEVALNEGGGLLTSNDFARVDLASIGVAEKTYQSYVVTAKGGGGHSSIPKAGDDPVLALARALVKVGEHRFPARVLPAVRGYLAAAATWEKAPVAAALARASETAELLPDDEKVLSNERAYNAMVRTTCVTTMLEGSPQDNVLPTTAVATVNCRILPDETREDTQAALVRVIGDPQIDVKPDSDHGVGPMSDPNAEPARILADVARKHFPSAKVITSMSAGATDSRHLRGTGMLCYGVSAAPTSIDEIRAGRGAHGPDERRPTKWLGPAAKYLRDAVVALAR